MADLRMSYEQSVAALEKGISIEFSRLGIREEDPGIRVGIDKLRAESAALVVLLVDKGIFTLDEYIESLRQSMTNEVTRYEHLLFRKYDIDIKLG